MYTPIKSIGKRFLHPRFNPLHGVKKRLYSSFEKNKTVTGRAELVAKGVLEFDQNHRYHRYFVTYLLWDSWCSCKLKMTKILYNSTLVTRWSQNWQKIWMLENSYRAFLQHNNKRQIIHRDSLFHSSSHLDGHACLHNNHDVALGLGTYEAY